MSTVIPEPTRFTDLRRRLLKLHPDLEEQTLFDTLEAATDLREALTALLRSALEDEARIESLRELQENMTFRLARLDSRACAKRQVVQEALEEADIPKLLAPDFTAGPRSAAPSLLIIDEEAIPPEYLLPQPPMIDRHRLLKALLAGAKIPGVGLAAPRNTLSVRTL